MTEDNGLSTRSGGRILSDRAAWALLPAGPFTEVKPDDCGKLFRAAGVGNGVLLALCGCDAALLFDKIGGRLGP